MIRIMLLVCLVCVIPLRSALAAAPEKTSSIPASKTPSVRTANSPSEGDLSGKVVETMNAGGYTYVCIEKRGKKTWVAVPESKVTVGEEMSFRPGQAMTNFTSKSLNRTFDVIVFSSGPGAAGPVAGNQALPPGHAPVTTAAGSVSGSKAQTAPKDLNVKVEKATGANAYTVAEIYAKRIELNKKPVVVRGKVVKVSEGIMGRNWLHLQDGSGDQKKGTHNLVVTTEGTAAIGDVVTITGKLSKDKDFGAGYLYKVIIEDAKIAK